MICHVQRLANVGSNQLVILMVGIGVRVNVTVVQMHVISHIVEMDSVVHMKHRLIVHQIVDSVIGAPLQFLMVIVIQLNVIIRTVLKDVIMILEAVHQHVV